MAQSSRPTPWGRQLVRMLRQAVADEEGHGLPAISHRLPIATPDGKAPRIFTVDLSPDQEGTFLVTCREVPDVVMFTKDEEDALVRAEQAIREVLVARRSASDFPF